ncbi:3-phosphoshikimate 1-carboxyvinyltransferase [Candidatus Pantoea edessiphila]|uniref:3-phosphoshikimate 1-carboxyvinyltransferase n=1 Tax=Candidatus Pantoea edessiphila TaxID=2044610 RepID=A0A2P5SYX0_9GAMM|nr:3-phosphoshikimate 1-carboxyvinyltransferase [Candidatus Pantoea edessiphila]MBK4775326.1 3-phosphoshikimate 1-carboxyvinyltransferase [Pantoea sp. Edef]PPI87538.1 3-phosphoshikimate 1-carboxyvinyltransferase [Candidatus Pantoea edessiphila]
MHSSITLKPIYRVNGTVNLPGSKSISNRVLLLAAVAKGTTELKNLLNSDDVKYMLEALKELGVHYKLYDNNTTCKIIGNSGPLKSSSSLKLFLGNAGTVMRPLTAMLCLESQDIILTGEKRMKERPIGHLVEILREGGAKIDYLEHINYPPLRIFGGFAGGQFTIDSSLSSQFLTALLMLSPLAQKDTRITVKDNLVSKPYIDITLKVMRDFGVEVQHQNYRNFFIEGKQQYHSPKEYLIEGDASAASYFLAAAAIKGGTVTVRGIGSQTIQGDIRFVDIIEKMGAVIYRGKDYISCTAGELRAVNMDLNDIPDAAMTIAIMALFAKGTTTIRNIYNWRIKETDRMLAMSTELRKLGAEVEEGHDYIVIKPLKKIIHANIHTYNDHRIAMCFSLIALSDKSVTIIDPSCTTKTFPKYFKEFAKISHCY